MFVFLLPGLVVVYGAVHPSDANAIGVPAFINVVPVHHQPKLEAEAKLMLASKNVIITDDASEIGGHPFFMPLNVVDAGISKSVINGPSAFSTGGDDYTMPPRLARCSKIFNWGHENSCSAHRRCDLPHVPSGGSALVHDIRCKRDGINVAQFHKAWDWQNVYGEIGPNLRLAHGASDFDGALGGSVGGARLEQGPQKQTGAYENYRCRPKSVLGHPLGGVVHSLCGHVHAFLGSKIAYLTGASFGLAGLAGFLFQWGFDYANRKRRRRFAAISGGAFCALLGLGTLIVTLP